jgi:phenylacetate-CoA ligase
MGQALLNLYHRLPPTAASAVASARGLYLRAWRYGRDTERLVAEAVERDRWSAAQWRAWRDERLAMVLHRAATRVPYYREQWAARRRNGDRSSWELLENWPILEKATLRTRARDFVADDCDVRRMFHEHTSGTTGTSLDLWWSRATVVQWYALVEARLRRWHGVSRRDRWGILGGQLVTPVTRRTPPFWVWNAALKQLYMSSYHLAPDLVPAYLQALSDYGVRHLLGYSSALYELALAVSRNGRRDVSLAVVTTNAEPLFPHQRQTIQDAFGCPVRESYGMAEIVVAASECEAGALHQWPDVGVLEYAGGAEDGQPQDVVGTGLLNIDMPLIRYRVGDRARPAEAGATCACGRGLPLIAGIEGRSDDLLRTRDGRRVGRLDPIFKKGLPIIEAQILQDTIDHIRVRYVPAQGFSSDTSAALTREIQARLGDVRVTLEAMTHIPRTASGKFRAVICNIDKATDDRFAGVREQ